MSLKRKRDMDGILKSRKITFIIGPHKVPYTVHEASISRLSRPLHVLVTGPMKESMEAEVIWEDIEPDVFVNFVEYAYTQDFSISGYSEKTASGDEYLQGEEHHWQEKPNEKEGNVDADKNGDEDNDAKSNEMEGASLFSLMLVYVGYKAGTRKYGRYDFARKNFVCNQSCKFKLVDGGMNTYDEQQIRASENSVPYDLEYFMSLAKLYVIADKYDISRLRNLCAFKFGHSLLHAPGHEKLLHDVVHVLRYLHGTARPRDQLRSVLLKFLITDMEWAMECNAVRYLLQDIPELASELFLLVPPDYWVRI